MACKIISGKPLLVTQNTDTFCTNILQVNYIHCILVHVYISTWFTLITKDNPQHHITWCFCSKGVVSNVIWCWGLSFVKKVWTMY